MRVRPRDLVVERGPMLAGLGCTSAARAIVKASH